MNKHFEKLYVQREEMQYVLQDFKGKEWERPYKDKWSFGETYYHLYLLIKWFRKLNVIYLPLAQKIATVLRNKTYSTISADVYTQYKLKHNKPMKAPTILIPPKDVESKVAFKDIIKLIDKETKNLEHMVSKIDDDIAGHICYPDPLANNPNLIQSIDLLGIHENHHFLLCKKYYNAQ